MKLSCQHSDQHLAISDRLDYLPAAIYKLIVKASSNGTPLECDRTDGEPQCSLWIKNPMK